MIDAKDVHALRLVRSELTKHMINTSRADIRVMHNVLYVRGFVEPDKGSQVRDIASEMERLKNIFKQKAQLREVVLDCNYPK